MPRRMQLARDGENAIVRLVEIKRERRARIASSDADRSALLVPHHTLKQRALTAQPIERARHLPRVSPRFVVAFLESVELFDHREGNDHLMFGELEDGARVVKQHIRVEHEMLAHRDCITSGFGASFLCRFGSGLGARLFSRDHLRVVTRV